MADHLTYPLRTIDWTKLQKSDTIERRSLLSACQTDGFFFLDLSSDEVLLQDWTSILASMAEYFSRPVDEKMRDSRKSDTHGYEPVATSAGAVVNLPDYYESLKASKDEVFEKNGALPSVVLNNHAIFERFLRKAQDIVITILRELDSALGINADFDLRHREGYTSLSTLGVLHYPKQDTLSVGVGHNKHTDLGTLTFLLCQQWGLQVLTPEGSGWKFVAPKANHAVINVGDTLRFLSGNRLRSAVHRVVPTQSLQHESRYTIAYFLRSENDTVFKDSLGRIISAEQWHNEKFNVFREPHELQESRAIATGGMEKAEILVA